MSSLNNIRGTFINYFEKLDHKPVESSTLVPLNDPTLMFTNSGMVQFKNLFTGLETREYKRAVTSQKCVRAGGKHNDLDNVGYTARHHTFFEMLGNFSFGDYFKEKAIPYAWDLLTKELCLDKEKLLVTVFHDDTESAEIWKKYAGLPEEKIIRIATSDNFWSMGSTGPCGPCSEIFYDHGPTISGGPPGSKNEDGDRFVEIWNLVFMQFEQFEDGSRELLPSPSIDTGMGLERIGAVLQGTHDNYQTDTIQKLIEASADVTSTDPYGDKNIHHRVIADHLRSSSFLISEGVLPANEGRGYVLRRIMRRAMRHVNLLGVEENVLYRLVSVLIQEMGQAFPELVSNQKIIQDTLNMEETRFKVTLERGLKILDAELENLPDGGTLDGEVAFKLYDTFGFPLDLTQDALREKGYDIDINGFELAMDKQKEKARASWSGSGGEFEDGVWFSLSNELQATEFLGYDSLESEGQILGLLIDGKAKDHVEKDSSIQIILNQTPFYAESGGQVSDIGTIVGLEGTVQVTKVLKKGSLFVHYGKVVDGVIRKNSGAKLIVNGKFREKVASNHSATHLLHESLRLTLGSHVSQKGSLNDYDRIRFDFSHSKALTSDEMSKIENDVNFYIRQNSEVETRVMAPKEAVKLGARALFGEKYGEEVRVVYMGFRKGSGIGADKDTFSLELCGGTHVKKTGDIGLFKLVNESASSNGVRRVEAITGNTALNFIKEQQKILENIEKILKTKSINLVTKLENILEEKKQLKSENFELRKRVVFGNTEERLNIEFEEIKGVNFVSKSLDGVPSKDLRGIVDEQKSRIKTGIIVITSTHEKKVSIIAGVTEDLVGNVSSISLVQIVAKITGGKGGGGRPDMAQAGGVDATKIPEALESVRAHISNCL